VQQVCARTLILSHGRIVAEHRLNGAAGGETLEAVFSRVTEQQDYSILAGEILQVIKSS